MDGTLEFARDRVGKRTGEEGEELPRARPSEDSFPKRLSFCGGGFGRARDADDRLSCARALELMKTDSEP